MKHGVCKLCLKEADLLDSHYLPRSTYAANMAKSRKNPNPVVLARGTAKQVSDQLRGHTFCAECENLLNKNGEKWVLAHLPRDYKAPFPLQETLISATPTIYGDNINIYEGGRLADFDIDQLIYFGMSVFWRGACRQWNSSTGATAPPVELGEFYEPIRQFLLGGPFPQNVHIVILVHNLKPVGNAAVTVQRAKSGYGDFYWFYINGLGFMLYLGDGLPKEAESLCAEHGANAPVVVDRAFSNMVYSFLKDLLHDSDKSESVMNLIKIPQNQASDIGKKPT